MYPEHLHLPIPSEAFGISPKEMSTEAATPHNAVTYSKVCPVVVRRQITRLQWTPEEDAKVLKMREEGYLWEDIHASLSHQSKGTIREWHVTCRYQHFIRSSFR